MQVVRLTPRDVLEHWKIIKVAIEKSLHHSVGETTSFDIFHWLMNPDYAQCWMVIEKDNNPVNITITKVNKYAQHTSLHIVSTTSINGSRWKNYKAAHHVIEDFARSIKAKRIEMYGRKGWQRNLKQLKGKLGETYTKSYVVMSMFLKENQ